MNSFRIPLAVVSAVVCLSFAGVAVGGPLGSLDVANCSGGGITITATTITWLPTGTVAGTGCVNTGAGTNVVYSGGVLGAGATGNIKNVTAGGPSTIDQFITFLGTPLDFVLTSLPAAVPTNDSNCASTTLGQSCTVFPGSPFLFTNLGSNTSIALQAVGTVSDATGTSTWAGAFTTQVNVTAASIQQTILGGGSITTTYSGQFTVASAVPEPGTISMLSLGALLLGFGIKRRKA